MQYQVLALLILTCLAQEKKDERAFVEPARVRHVVTVNVMMGGDRREIAVSWAAPPAPADEDEDHPPPRPRPRLTLKTAVVESENFDRWLFPAERSEPARLSHLEGILRAKVDAAAREHKLTDPQRAKLRLAGRGDIKRFFDQVEDRRSAFEIDRRSFNTGFAALRRLEPLSQLYQEGPFGDGSLFAKTLQRISEDQKSGR